VAEFFAGIGFVRLALERQGFRVAFANDIDALRRHWQRGMLAKWLKFL
jgi:site-specific DNA-cytosine methylase